MSYKKLSLIALLFMLPLIVAASGIIEHTPLILEENSAIKNTNSDLETSPGDIDFDGYSFSKANSLLSNLIFSEIVEVEQFSQAIYDFALNPIRAPPWS